MKTVIFIMPVSHANRIPVVMYISAGMENIIMHQSRVKQFRKIIKRFLRRKQEEEEYAANVQKEQGYENRKETREG